MFVASAFVHVAASTFVSTSFVTIVVDCNWHEFDSDDRVNNCTYNSIVDNKDKCIPLSAAS